MMATLAATIGRGTLAARPATMPVGTLYYVTDTSTLYRSNGAGWDSIEAATAAAYTDEQARDAIGAALTAGAGITITPSDPADTITIAATGTVVGTHTHTAADVSDFSEATDDRAASLLVAGSGITLSYNDAANTLTIAAAGGSGGPRPAWRTGRWYGAFESVYFATTSQSSVPLTSTLLASPVFVPAARAIDRVGFQVSTAASAGTLARVGIYADAGTSGPGALLLDAGTVAIDTTGTKTITVSSTLPAGWVWAAITVGASCQLTMASGGVAMQGQTTPDSAAFLVREGSLTGGTAAAPPASALPGTFGTPASSSANVFLVWVRAA